MNSYEILAIVIAVSILIIWAFRAAEVSRVKPFILNGFQKGLPVEIIVLLLARDKTRSLGRVLTSNEVNRIKNIVGRVIQKLTPLTTPMTREDIMKYLMQQIPPIFLQAGERVVSVMPAIGLREPRSIRVSHGKSGSSRIHVAKGINLRVGTSTSRSESHEELRDIDGGDLVITNQRIIFTGPKKTINVAIRKIVSIEPFSNYIILHKDGRERAQYFLWPDNLLPFENTDEGKKFLTGSNLQSMIENHA